MKRSISQDKRIFGMSHLALRTGLALAIASSTLIAGTAFAETAVIPKGTAPSNAPATKGATEVAGTGSFAAQTKVEDATGKDATELTLNAGGLIMGGNSRNISLTAGAKLRLRRGQNQIGAQFFGNYARGGKPGAIEDTAANLQGLLRDDYFFADNFAAFLQVTGRHDKFQGLDFRLTIDPGVAAYLIETKKQRAWIEAGLQIQHDIRNESKIIEDARKGLNATDPTPPLPDFTATFANARVYLGYENKLYENVSFNTGLEYIQNLHESASRYRLNFDAGLAAKVSDKFSVATTYTMRFENQPLPNVEKTDNIVAVNLLYSLF